MAAPMVIAPVAVRGAVVVIGALGAAAPGIGLGIALGCIGVSIWLAVRNDRRCRIRLNREGVDFEVSTPSGGQA